MEIGKARCAVAFGYLMAEAREKKGLLQREMAEKIGTSQAYYSQLETGRRIIDLCKAAEVCKILDIDLNAFVLTI